nr:MAG TPA: hypothetical protein [Caudoviricetes sp.]
MRSERLRVGAPRGVYEKRQTAPLSPQNIRQNKKALILPHLHQAVFIIIT